MNKVLQLKRGTKNANDSYTGAIAELTYDTESKELRVHDGVTQGGKVVGGLTSVSWNDVTDKPTIPSMTSQLTNDSNFVDSLEATQIANNSASNAVTNHNGNSNAHSNIITPIKNVIPTAATSSNPLADRKWVLSTLESFTGIIYKVKGSVATYNDLPQDAQPGDVYNVTDTGANYVYVDYTDIDSSKSTDIGETVVNISNQYALLSKFNEWGTTQNADITHLTLQKTSAEATTYTVKYYWMASDQEGEDPTEHSQTLNNISTNVLGNWGITISTFDATTVLAITRNKLGWDKLSETVTTDWDDITNKPTTFTPSAHTHTVSDITDFPTIPTVGNGTITITQGGTTKGTFTTNQSGNTTIALDAGGSGSGQLPDYSTTSNISLESTQGDINLTSSSGGVEINASGTATINGDEVVLNSSVAGGNTAEITISNTDGISIDTGNKPFELHAGSSIDFNSEGGIDINFSFNNLTNAEHYAYFSSSNFYDFSSSTVNNVETSKTLDTGNDFFEVEVKQDNTSTTPVDNLLTSKIRSDTDGISLLYDNMYNPNTEWNSETKSSVDVNGGGVKLEWYDSSNDTTANISLSSPDGQNAIATVNDPLGMSDEEIANVKCVKEHGFDSMEFDEPLFKKTFYTDFMNGLNFTYTDGEIKSFDNAGSYIDPLYYTPNYYLGTYQTTSLQMPYKIPGSLVLSADKHTLVSPTYTSGQSSGRVYAVLWGYYNVNGEFIPVIINHVSVGLVLASSNTTGWVNADGQMGYTSAIKLSDVNAATSRTIVTGGAGDAQKGWQFIYPATGSQEFSYYLCDEVDGTLSWYKYSRTDLGLTEKQCSRINTCMLLCYFYNGDSVSTSSNAVYNCSDYAYDNMTSDRNRGTNILLKNKVSTTHREVGLSLNFWTGTQAEYDALPSKDDNTLYIIKPAS